jgi:hypothetical protein
MPLVIFIQHFVFKIGGYFQTLEREARMLAEQATTGRFLDPNQPPLQILSAMKEVCF